VTDIILGEVVQEFMRAITTVITFQFNDFLIVPIYGSVLKMVRDKRKNVSRERKIRTDKKRY